MIHVFKEFRLYCAHSVQSFGPDHKCSRKHGHTYKIRVEVGGVIDAKSNILIPFDEIEAAWSKVGAPLDHTDLNDALGPNATTEILAIFLQGQLSVELRRSVSVCVQETETSGVYVKASS